MVSDLKTFAHKGCKIATAKKVLYGFFFICSHCLNVYLPPLPEVQCSKILDFQNPWGKSNGNKWFQIWRLLLIKGVKLQRKKNFFFGEFCLTSRIFFCIGGTVCIAWEMLCLQYAGFFCWRFGFPILQKFMYFFC